MPILRQYGTDNHSQSPCLLLSCPGMRKQDRARWAETLAPWTHLLQLPQVLCANGTRHSAATLKTSSTQFVFTSYPFLRKGNAGVQKVSNTSDKSSNARNFEGSSFASRRGLSRALCLCRNQCKRAWNSMCGCWAIGAHHDITSLVGEGFWQDQQQIHMHLILMGALVHAKTTWSELNPSTIMCMPFLFPLKIQHCAPIYRCYVHRPSRWSIPSGLKKHAHFLCRYALSTSDAILRGHPLMADYRRLLSGNWRWVKFLKALLLLQRLYELFKVSTKIFKDLQSFNMFQHELFSFFLIPQNFSFTTFTDSFTILQHLSCKRRLN